MLFTSLAYAFFSDLENPFTTNPPEIILISPMGALLPLSLAPFTSHPFVVFYMVLFFIQTLSASILAELVHPCRAVFYRPLQS